MQHLHHLPSNISPAFQLPGFRPCRSPSSFMTVAASGISGHILPHGNLILSIQHAWV